MKRFFVLFGALLFGLAAGPANARVGDVWSYTSNTARLEMNYGPSPFVGPVIDVLVSCEWRYLALGKVQVIYHKVNDRINQLGVNVYDNIDQTIILTYEQYPEARSMMMANILGDQQPRQAYGEASALEVISRLHNGRQENIRNESGLFYFIGSPLGGSWRSSQASSFSFGNTELNAGICLRNTRRISAVGPGFDTMRQMSRRFSWGLR